MRALSTMGIINKTQPTPPSLQLTASLDTIQSGRRAQQKAEKKKKIWRSHSPLRIQGGRHSGGEVSKFFPANNHFCELGNGNVVMPFVRSHRDKDGRKNHT